MGAPVLFGIRHLSPAAAFQLRRALDAARPELVLVEGPSDLTGQIEWLCHPETRFPAAIMAYTREPPVRTILYPFAIYSPEVQAIFWANEHKVPCRFMDLPSSVFLAGSGQAAAGSAVDGETGNGDPAEQDVPTTESVYRRLETLTGEDHDTFWERTFEQLGDGEGFQPASNTFGRQLRAASEDDRRIRRRPWCGKRI